ncbi:MAG: methionine gamma-lyase family protein, partial [Clostridia bacterium]|nr:methionine gamma-lyase family protein [Clostridia bacterium]
DNCYGEFVSTREPIEVGADIIAGSLIKNIGGGLAPTGGYIAGRAELVESATRRLTAPSLGDEVGSYNSSYAPFFEGLFIAPHVVAGALKGNVLLGKTAKACGFKTSPEPSHVPEDIIRTITFDNKDKFIDFVQSIQSLSPVDSFLVLEPYRMPGYNDDIIMASGSFVQGSSIELSCDGPVRPPYIAYMQGGITYEHIKLVARELLAKNQ